jgi:hypothetical protein
LNNVLFSPLPPAGLGVAVMVGMEFVEVLLIRLDELLGLVEVELVSTSLLSVVLGLGLAVVSVLRLGILDDVTTVVDPSSLLTPTKRPAAARSKHKQRHSSALNPIPLGSNIVIRCLGLRVWRRRYFGRGCA